MATSAHISDIHGALKVLELSLPCTAQQVKSAFRRQSFKLHPDHGGTAEAFRRLKQAYDVLISSDEVIGLPKVDVFVVAAVDGTPLSELGLGLGPNVNGRICHECAGNGYTSYDATCYECQPPTARITCRSCDGLPFYQKMHCRHCYGSGYILWVGHAPKTCRCKGTGVQKTYITCGACNGKGEQKIYNPVIPKNRMR